MFGFYTASSPTSGQVLELSCSGSYKTYHVIGTAFVQPGGVLGAYSPVDDDEVLYKGEVFETEVEALQCALGFPPLLVPSWWEENSLQVLHKYFGTVGIRDLKVHSLWVYGDRLYLQGNQYLIGEAIINTRSLKFRPIEPEFPENLSGVRRISQLMHPESRPNVKWLTKALNTLKG